MADIALLVADRVRIVESIVQDTLPAGETIKAGAPVRIDSTTGNFMNGNGTTATEAAIYGIATHTVVKGQGLTALRLGVLDGLDLSGLDYGDKVYVSDTDGRLADSAGTVSVVVGKVQPIHAHLMGGAPGKVLFVDFNN